ncbi:hypothetical protein ACFU99_01670 [Streptomyces sp. NPDC057654]|uniref:hypothetical protein n=1 Tax=Streptomyces sp. NPDC057654 TaxID=3346196 RepID=UPI0036BFAA16
MTAFQPAFEVTHVDSMQWNRTAMNVPENQEGQAPVAPLSDDVLARVQAAVKSETAHAQR